MDKCMNNQPPIKELEKAVEAFVAKQQIIAPLTLDELLTLSAEFIKQNQSYQPWEKWVVIFLNNAFWKPVLQKLAPRRTLLMIPQCLKNSECCKASIDEFGLLCESCGGCALQNILEVADQAGMMSMVAEGSTMVAGLIEGGQVDAVIGVSCFEALEKAFMPMIANAVAGMALPLNREGCKNTGVDIDALTRIICESSDPGCDEALVQFKPLMQKVKEVFCDERLSYIMGLTPTRSDTIAREWLLGEGKRYRPFLVVATAVSAGFADVDNRNILRLAVAVECFHKASLAHDDIEDNDSTRNGRPTLHQDYGIPVALNSGDLLLGEGYRMVSELEVSPARKAQLLEVAVKGHLELCQGQGQELIKLSAGVKIGVEEMLRIFRLKTAPAFNVAFQFGAILAGCSKVERKVLEQFSGLLGIAYQLQDDLQDAEHDSQKSEASIISALMLERALDFSAAFRVAEEMLASYKQKALFCLRPLTRFPLKRLLFMVVHSIIKKRPVTDGAKDHKDQKNEKEAGK